MGQCIFASSFQFWCDFLDALLVPHSMSLALWGRPCQTLLCKPAGVQGGSPGSVQVVGHLWVLRAPSALPRALQEVMFKGCPALSCSKLERFSYGIYRSTFVSTFKKSRGIKYIFFWVVACIRVVHRKTKGFLGWLMLCCRLVPAQPGSCTRAFGSLCFWSPCSRRRQWFLFSLCTLFC